MLTSDTDLCYRHIFTIVHHFGLHALRRNGKLRCDKHGAKFRLRRIFTDRKSLMTYEPETGTSEILADKKKLQST